MVEIDIEKVLSRGVSSILPGKSELADLMKKKKITLYQGFDPSSSALHLGNFIGVRKLAQFQKLGHKVIFLIGDYTGMIGDPTDKSSARKKLTHQEVLENASGWKEQIKNIIDFDGKNKAEIKYNSEWLSKLTFEELINLSSNFTVQQMLERDFFQNRIREGKPIHLHEFLYPLMQGYDSVELHVDLEVGGNDQLFNMMAGRALMKTLKDKDKFVLTTKLLTDPSGKKMGKSEGNTINLTDKPSDVYGKIMALPDEVIPLAIELLTDLSLETHEKATPLNAKKLLAHDVVKQIHNLKTADEAQNSFENAFQKSEPDFERKISKKETLAKTIAQVSLVGSVSEAKRLIQQSAVDVDGKTSLNPSLEIKGGEEIKIGKKVFVKIKK